MEYINISRFASKYSRIVESMGKGLVMVEIHSIDKRTGANYHYFFSNGRKPPLDVALSPYDSEIAYITYFIQDEKVILENEMPQVTYADNSLKIAENVFSEKLFEINVCADFSVYLNGNNLVVVSKNEVSALTAYSLGQANCLLLNRNGHIAGFIMKHLTKNERNALVEADVI